LPSSGTFITYKPHQLDRKLSGILHQKCHSAEASGNIQRNAASSRTRTFGFVELAAMTWTGVFDANIEEKLLQFEGKSDD
jgi:hypothetical protein